MCLCVRESVCVCVCVCVYICRILSWAATPVDSESVTGREGQDVNWFLLTLGLLRTQKSNSQGKNWSVKTVTTPGLIQAVGRKEYGSALNPQGLVTSQTTTSPISYLRFPSPIQDACYICVLRFVLNHTELGARLVEERPPQRPVRLQRRL